MWLSCFIKTLRVLGVIEPRDVLSQEELKKQIAEMLRQASPSKVHEEESEVGTNDVAHTHNKQHGAPEGHSAGFLILVNDDVDGLRKDD